MAWLSVDRGAADPARLAVAVWAPAMAGSDVPRARERAWMSRQQGVRGLDIEPSAHLVRVISGFPFSTTYVASSAPSSLPMFLAEWIVPAGTNRTSPA